MAKNDDAQKQKRFDPLTGRIIQVSSNNGFSTFRDETAQEEVCFLKVKTGLEAKHFAPFEISDRAKERQGSSSTSMDESNNHHKKKLSHFINFHTGSSSNQDPVFKRFFDSWVNPVIGVSKDRTLEAQLDIMLPRQRGFKQGSEALVFSKQDLINIQVIGQVDNKFIACLMILLREKEDESTILVLIDQHAAHERIRLEQLEDEFLKDVEESSGRVRSESFSSPVHLNITIRSDLNFRNLKSSFQRIGVEYAIISEFRQDDKMHIDLKITKMPAIFVKKMGKTGYDAKCVLEHSTIKELLYSHIGRYQENSLHAHVIPHSIHNVLCSYACHGAIKFGDPLSLAQCQSMIQSLSKCKLPFQCAHGRPSVAPLINMSSLTNHTHGGESVNFSRLRK